MRNHYFGYRSTPVRVLAIAGMLAALEMPALAGEVPSGATAGFGKKRQWSDQSGKFKVAAKLVEADKKNIQLEKEDGRVVTIQLSKMSESDQAFVNSFLDAAEASSGGRDGSEDADNPFSGGKPKGKVDPVPANPTPSRNKGEKRNNKGSEEKATETKSSDEIPLVKFNANRAKPLTMTNSAPFWKAGTVAPMNLKPAEDQVTSVSIKKGFFDGASMLVAGVKRKAIISVLNTDHGGANKFSRLSAVDLESDDLDSIGNYTDPWRLYAIAPNGRRFMAISVSMWNKGNDIGIFDQADNGTYEPQFRFTAGGGDWAELMWVGFLTNTRIVTISQKNDLTIWDLEAKTATHRGNTGGPQQAAIGGKGELIAIPTHNSIVFLRGEDGKQVGVVSVEGSSAPVIAFSPDGESIAASVPFAVHIYSLKDGSLTKTISIAENNAAGSIEWLGKNVLVNNKLLIDVEQGIPIWSYDTAGSQASVVFGGQLHTLFAGENGGSIVSYNLPHLAVEDFGKKRDAKDLYALGPGSKFRVQADFRGMTQEEQRACRDAIVNRLTKMGWVESNQAENEVRLGLVQGERQEAEYEESRFPFGGGPPPGFRRFGGPSGPTTKASSLPWQHSIAFLANGTEVYRTEITIGTPGNIQLKEGETTQQAVDRLCRPNPDFFKNAQFPKQMMKPEFREGFGKSKITDRGMQ